MFFDNKSTVCEDLFMTLVAWAQQNLNYVKRKL